LTKIGRFLAQTAWKSPRRFSKKTNRFIGETGQFIGAPGFTVPPSSPVRFGQIFSIFTDFYRIFQKLTGSVTSGFCGSTEFSNTGCKVDG
jgi:hypothetical protein